MEKKERFRQNLHAVKLFQQSNYPENPFRQIEYELLYINEGEGELYTGNFHVEVHKGDFVFIDSFEEHYFKPGIRGEKFSCFRLLFDISALGNTDEESRTFFLSIRLCRFLKIPEALISRFCETADKLPELEGQGLILRSLLFEVLAYAVSTKQYEVVSEVSPSRKRSLSAIENSITYIQNNFTEFLNLGTLLQLTNYSKSQFIRLFKESTGMNVSEYINKFRIEKACLDLIYTNNNITEIATANGFNNIQYFSRKFKEYMACTPKQYQKKRKKLMER